MPNTSGLGLRIRLRRLQPAELPPHPLLAKLRSESSPADPKIFCRDVLNEARAFTTDYWPKKFEVKSSSKSSPPSAAPVELLVRDISASEIPEAVRPEGASGIVESWFARSSIHENKKEVGTATYDEFERYLLDDHSEHEKDYTPSVYDAHKVLEWDPNELQGLSGWEKVDMSIYEMCHSMPPPLNNRVFSVLVVKARTSPIPGFLTVQIPVDISQLPQALYSNGRNKTDGESAQHMKETTRGIYVSVESGELIDEGKKVRWQMGTASDAGGVLPGWVQKLGVPGAVVKDVGLFMDWLSKTRDKRA